MLHRFALKNHRKIRIYLPKPNCGVMKVQGGMLWGLPRAGKPKRLFAEAGFSEESEGTGDRDVEAHASRRAAARSKDRQMKEGSEPRPGAGRKWEE